MTCAENTLILTKLNTSRVPPEIQDCVGIHANMTWKAFVYDKELTMSRLVAGAPALLCTTTAVKSLLLSLDSGYICEGNRDGKFQELLSYKGFSDSSSKCWCYVYSTCICVHTCVGKAFTHVHTVFSQNLTESPS